MALIRSKKSSFGESSVTLKNETLTPTQYSSSQIRTGGGSNDPGRVKMHLFGLKSPTHFRIACNLTLKSIVDIVSINVKNQVFKNRLYERTDLIYRANFDDS